MKLIKIKASDASPSMKTKVAGNVFVEVYKDGKGFYYKIVIPGFTSYESKDRGADQMKVASAGEAHAKAMIKKIESGSI